MKTETWIKAVAIFAVVAVSYTIINYSESGKPSYTDTDNDTTTESTQNAGYITIFVDGSPQGFKRIEQVMLTAGKEFRVRYFPGYVISVIPQGGGVYHIGDVSGKKEVWPGKNYPLVQDNIALYQPIDPRQPVILTITRETLFEFQKRMDAFRAVTSCE